MKNNIILEDTTLRDGEQSPNIAFTASEKRRIFDCLLDTGVKWIEVGIPAMGGTEKKVLQEFCERKNEAQIVSWNRGNREDIKQSIQMGFEVIHIGLPTSNIHIKNSINKSATWVIDKAVDLVKYAKDNNCFVSISAEDIARTDVSLLKDYANSVFEAGADRLRLSDTIGVLTPNSYAEKVSLVHASCDIDIQCHAHNDFGLGVANTISGLEAGARYFHATVNGVGERAGMPDLAQLVVALKVIYGNDLGIDLKKLSHLSSVVADATGIAPPPWQPIVGDNAFSHESGIHTNATINDKSSFEPFPPELLGRKHKITIGKHSGKQSIKYFLSKYELTDTDYDVILYHVREFSMSLGRGLSVDELELIKNAVCKMTYEC